MYEELVKALRHPWQYNGLISDLTDSAADVIEELTATAESYKRGMEAWADEAARTQPRWIPVTERLPEYRERVLCLCRDGWIYIGRLSADECDNRRDGVRWWQPLPKPPKEVQP